ncbi:probable RNA-directed DNA polymerase from transposon BS [Trichonephila clavipes]|nr:probable RNA-directed DNA polymerase from transposon BS [Trichonephila clavipes]
MIDHLGLSGRQKFVDIINCSWNKGQLPRDWRRAIVIPIKKCSKTHGTPESYQSIALTSIACKIMEKMVVRKLTFHLHSGNLLPKEQHGFREGHSTTDQILYFCQRIRDAHNRKPTNHTVAVFLDLSEAFDRVWNKLLVSKLYKMFGVPQGPVLSPTLFSFYLTGIESVIKSKSEVGAFVDIVLWKSDSDLTKLERDINLVPEDIRNVTLDHKLTFNPKKSIVSVVTTNRKLYNFHHIFLYNQTLTVDKHPKYLGFVLDPEILGNKHIHNIVLKARQWLNILRYISGRDWGANAVTLKNTYVLLISWSIIFEYGVPVHCSASITNGSSSVLLGSSLV